MKIKFNILYQTVLLIGLASCSDIFESNIDSKQVNVIAPSDGLHPTAYSTTFWWDPVDGAFQYNLQLVKPDFSSATILLDTIIKINKFTYSLNPGTYQWRIRAESGSSKTAYVTRNITMDTLSLAPQSIVLMSPVNASSINSTTVDFQWQPLFGTTNYKLEVDTITGNFSGTLKLNQLTLNIPYTNIFTKNGKYQWRVRATNATEQSQYSEIRTFTLF